MGPPRVTTRIIRKAYGQIIIWMCPQTIVGFRDSCTMGKLPWGKIFFRNKGRCFGWYSRKLHFYHKSHFAFSPVICCPPFCVNLFTLLLALNFLCKGNWRYLWDVRIIKGWACTIRNLNENKWLPNICFLIKRSCNTPLLVLFLFLF